MNTQVKFAKLIPTDAGRKRVIEPEAEAESGTLPHDSLPSKKKLGEMRLLKGSTRQPRWSKRLRGKHLRNVKKRSLQ